MARRRANGVPVTRRTFQDQDGTTWEASEGKDPSGGDPLGLPRILFRKVSDSENTVVTGPAAVIPLALLTPEQLLKVLEAHARPQPTNGTTTGAEPPSTDLRVVDPVSSPEATALENGSSTHDSTTLDDFDRWLQSFDPRKLAVQPEPSPDEGSQGAAMAQEEAVATPSPTAPPLPVEALHSPEPASAEPHASLEAAAPVDAGPSSELDEPAEAGSVDVIELVESTPIATTEVEVASTDVEVASEEIAVVEPPTREDVPEPEPLEVEASQPEPELVVEAEEPPAEPESHAPAPVITKPAVATTAKPTQAEPERRARKRPGPPPPPPDPLFYVSGSQPLPDIDLDLADFS